MKPRVRRESVAVRGGGRPWRVLFASDLHLGLPWTRRTADDLIEAADAESPDVVLLGGDLVERARGLDALERCVRVLAARRPVAAVLGNHDVAVGADVVRRRVLNGGGRWLADEPVELRRSDGDVLRCCDASARDVSEDAVNVACLHDPADAEAASRAGCDVAFAGHLHGGQCVLFERRGLQYPGAWFNRRTGRRFLVGAMRLLVGSGLGDTLPLRFNCPHEVILCELRGS